jgi:hypothetical protein
MNIEIPDIKFEEVCGYCFGDGRISQWQGKNGWKSAHCEYCNGIGTLVTAYGEKLLEFLKRHKDR